LLSDLLSRFNVDVGEDAGEWLGEEAAAFLSSGETSPTILLSIDDPDAARSALTEAVGNEVAMVQTDGFMVIGEEPVAADESSLAESDAYLDLAEVLDEHRVGLVYLSEDFEATELIGDEIGDGLLPPGRSVTTLAVRDDALLLDASADTDTELQDLIDALRDEAHGLPGIGVLERFGAVQTDDLGTGYLEGYEPVLTLDISKVPVLARAALAGTIDRDFGPLLGQLQAVELGVKEDGDRALVRLAATFSNA
jgi:hypothetical protein